MNDFRLSFKSVSGLIKGYLNPMTPISAAPSYGDPVYSSGFVLWKPYAMGPTTPLTRNQYYKPCKNAIPGCDTINDIFGRLTNEGATSASNLATLIEIQLHDEYDNPITSPSLVLRAYNDNNQVLRFVLQKKTISGSTISYSDLSPWRAVPEYANLEVGVYIVAGTITTGNVIGYGCGIIYSLSDYTEGMVQCEGEIFVANETGFRAALDNAMPEEKMADPGLGPESEPGGYGPGGGSTIGGIGGPDPTFDFSSDPIDITPLPPSISALGFTNIYKCDAGALTMLGATLFPDVSGSTDVWTAIVALSDSIWNSKLIDYVVSIHMVPCDVPAGSPEDIKIGTRTLMGIQGAKVTSDYVEVDLGNLKVDEVYTSFADFNCTRARLFLPFYGFVEIKPEYWQSATLNVMYRINVIDGSFLAIVKSTVNRHQPEMASIVGQYSGCACIHCPASGVSYASMFGGMVSNGAGVGISMASGNVAGVASSALNMAASSQGNMQHSNPYNASASIMGHAYPYLLIERPVSQFPTKYGSEQGYPLWVTKTLSSCKGLTICDNPVLNFGCTEEEGKAIIAALKEGVIL